MTEAVKNLTIKTSGPELDAGLLKLKEKLVETFTLDLSDAVWLKPKVLTGRVRSRVLSLSWLTIFITTLGRVLIQAAALSRDVHQTGLIAATTLESARYQRRGLFSHDAPRDAMASQVRQNQAAKFSIFS